MTIVDGDGVIEWVFPTELAVVGRCQEVCGAVPPSREITCFHQLLKYLLIQWDTSWSSFCHEVRAKCVHEVSITFGRPFFRESLLHRRFTSFASQILN